MIRKFKIIAGAVVVLGSLTACGVTGIATEPDMSPIDVSKEAFPEANVLRVPQPSMASDAPLSRAQGASLWSKSADSFFDDSRAAREGDILTVNIEIADKASLSNETEVEKEGANRVGAPVLLGYGTQLASVLPGVDAANFPQNDVIDLSSQSASKGSGTVARKEAISLKIAALVIDVLPNGTMVIGGRQEVRVNHELRELRVTGIVRREDISPENTISYDKIAEARVSYGGRGIISRAQTPAYGKEVLDVILPY